MRILEILGHQLSHAFTAGQKREKDKSVKIIKSGRQIYKHIVREKQRMSIQTSQ